ncbi:CDC27 family protein [Dysgonomonas sp. 25]|uniref:CDC27 family protein n=1 Tax=Dysgonomonas sp. 25 TaxID=2302933 RepID=UPI0013D4B927|nr:CDC27 family protein [Dysgonomonas sp. 25]NDV68649.1 hypothetical protein [Dysgonomonas sp. 25]
MKKNHLNTKSTLTTLFYIPTVVAALLLLTYSCSSSKVDPATDFSHKSQFQYKSKKPVSMNLFMQAKRANLQTTTNNDFADMYGIYRDSTKAIRVVLPEDDYLLRYVDFSEFDKKPEEIAADTLKKQVDMKLSQVENLAEVVATAKAQYAAERNGNVKLDFVVTVPKELLSKKWRVLLSPSLIVADSVQAMPEMMIRGEEFYNKQVTDEENYQKFLNSLVEEKDYDQVMVDRKQIRKSLKNLQNFYWKNYNADWNRQVDYEKWKFERGDVNAFLSAKEIAYNEKKYHENARKALDRVARDYVDGKDTVGLFARYMAEFEAKTNKRKNINKSAEQVSEKEVPKKFRDLHQSGRTVNDVKNIAVTIEDSLRIASHSFFYDDIALNEMAILRKEIIRKEIVKYPMDEYTGLELDTVLLNTDGDFEYRYSKTYPVTDDVQKLQIAMSGKIDAVDLSGYTMADSDTLKYYVSTLSQLIDSTLAGREIQIFRNVFDEVSVRPKYRAGKANFDIDFEDNRAQVEIIKEAYNRNRYERGLIIDSVVLRASSSLEGTYDMNLDLSRKRSIGMKEFLTTYMPSEVDVENTFKALYIGEDWTSAIKEVENNPNIQNKEAIVEMLSNAVFLDEVEQQMKIKYPADYRIIYRDIYPTLRKIDIIFNMSRPYMGVADSTYIKVNPDYMAGITHLKNRDYRNALRSLLEHQDYNTALCYACMGQNARAYNLLKKLPVTANSEYLFAIVAYNVDRKEEAVQHLLNACNSDPNKAYRIPLDNEITQLVEEYDLTGQIHDILKAKEERDAEEARLKAEEAAGKKAQTVRERDEPYDPEEEDMRIGVSIDDDEVILE